MKRGRTVFQLRASKMSCMFLELANCMRLSKTIFGSPTKNKKSVGTLPVFMSHRVFIHQGHPVGGGIEILNKATFFNHFSHSLDQ